MNRPLNIAHRGASSLAPENTLAAARKALEAGADLWELDVAVTADHELILFHDDSLARTTDVAQRFPDRVPWTFTTFTLAEIRTLDAGSWFVERDPHQQIAAGAVSPEDQRAYRGEPVPTLREALRFTRDHNWRVNIELKRLPPPLEDFPVVERVLALIDELDMVEQVVISSFVHPWLRQIRAQRPEIAVQALIGFSSTEPLDWGDLTFQTYNVRHTLTSPAEVRSRRAQGIAVNPFVVNQPDEMAAYIAAGVAGLITDFPQRLSRVLADWKEFSP